MVWDPVWEKVFKGQEWGKYPAESLIRFVARNFYQRDRKNINLLEIGCGPGANIWYMAREGFNVYGIDGSITAIDFAGRRIKSDGHRAQLSVGDVTRLPYNDAFFDGIIDAECLYSNSRGDAERALGEVHRVLKDKGLFYSRTFSERIDIGVSTKKAGNMEFFEVPEGPLKEKGFVRLMDRADVERLYGQFFKIISVDSLAYTDKGGSVTVGEWIIICEKDKR